MISKIINKQLQQLQNAGHIKFLSGLIHSMYKLKGKDVRNVSYLKELNAWEFEIGNDFFYSSGPGWAYDYPYLLSQFKANLGHHYIPKDGDVVFDIGAGVGEELMILSKCVGHTGRVFAVEAHPKTFKVLEYNKDKNSLDNTQLINYAINDVPGFVFIEDNNDSLGNKLISSQSANTFKVQAVTIEQLIDQFKIEKIDFIKVNIEGAEQLLIRGIGESIGKIKNLAISCHDFRYEIEGNEFFKTKSVVIEYLKDNKFEISLRTTSNPLLDDYVYASLRSGNES